MIALEQYMSQLPNAFWKCYIFVSVLHGLFALLDRL